MDAAPAGERLIGRETELARILKAFEAASAGQGGMVLLSGEPGIGKTRLAREVLARAVRSGARGCVGRSFEQHTGIPFFPFTEALTLPLMGPALLPEARALEKWPELAYLVPEAGPEQRVHDAHETQLRVFRAVTAFLREVAEESALVLLLDDLHWADATSLSLLLYLGRHLEGSRILLVLAYRDAELSREHQLGETVGELVRERLLDEVHLHPLALEATAGLIRQQLTGQAVSDELVALVHNRAAGNPFFTEELVKAVVEQGRIAPGQALGDPHDALAAMEVPHSVRAVVAHRVGRLPAETQELLRLASIIGQEIELSVLVAASRRPETEVLDRLDSALAARLLEQRRSGRIDRYAFSHALIQEALYAGLPNSLRRRLHWRIGEVLQLQKPDRASVTAELARHFLVAGDVERALGYALQSGREATARYAHAEAAVWYQQVVDLLMERGEQTRAAEAQYWLASELYDLNKLTDALAAYQAALRTFEQLGDTTGQARVHWGVALVHRGRYDLAAAMPHFNEALRLWPTEREDVELVSLLLDAARASHFSRDPAPARLLAARALALTERCDDPGLLARSLVVLAATRMRDDARPSPTVALLDRAERVALPVGDWRTLSYAYLARADGRELSGELEKALADRRAAVQAAERAGDTERLAFAYHVLAETHLMLGTWEEGRDAGRKGMALDPQEALRGMFGPSLLTWMSGQPADALVQTAEYAADARQRDDMQGLSTSLAVLADMALQVDRPVDAEAPAREAAQLLRGPGGWGSLPGVVCGPLAETVVRLATPDAADVLDAAEDEVRATEQYVARPQLLRARGLLLQQRGDLDAALEALTSGADIARSQRSVIQLGRTLHVLAAVARQVGDAALAAQTQTELVQLVRQIGPEVNALAWAKRGSAGTSAEGRSAAARADLLTPREREVALLLARGLTNRQIAQALVIAEGTAGVHVDHILNKLGFRSRAQVAAWAAERGLLAASTD